MRNIDALRCIDANEVLRIRGKDEVDGVVLNLDFMVCNPTDSVCNHNSIEDVRDYLGNPEYLLAFNTQSFQTRAFDKHTVISKRAQIYAQHINKQ